MKDESENIETFLAWAKIGSFFAIYWRKTSNFLFIAAKRSCI